MAHSVVVDSPNLRIVKDLWEVLESDGLQASLERMLEHAHEDIELRPYMAEGRVLRGVEEIRAFMQQELAEGATIQASPWSFEEVGDDVIVSGSVRIRRRDSSIADAQVRWTYTFRDGRLAAASSAPLAA
ncbi:MAG TPA: nuclear transport factor 2 family protein [Thermoleophilaceae bacterium]|nr:nuclear transport factor 2 family protein [Thermoleophilaceae bacterium]